MNKALKIVLIVVGVLILLVLVIPFLIPVNQFRPTIEEKASAALGRKVELGNLSLSLISGSVRPITCPLATIQVQLGAFPYAKSLKVGVEIMPLIFSKTLNVTGVTIASPQVTLLHTLPACGIIRRSVVQRQRPRPRKRQHHPALPMPRTFPSRN